jgi:hypothetical protein
VGAYRPASAADKKGKKTSRFSKKLTKVIEPLNQTKTVLMQTKQLALRAHLFTGVAAMAAGCLYTVRWIWELSEGILKNKQYPASLVTQNFFVVKIFMIVALITLCAVITDQKSARRSLLLACVGLLWTATTRTLEAYGAPGPWGVYSFPGLLLVFTGLLSAGVVTAHVDAYCVLGRLLTSISLLYFTGSFSAMLFYNLLGRDDSANKLASSIANLILTAEGVCWMLLGLYFLASKRQRQDFIPSETGSSPISPNAIKATIPV